MELNAEQIIKAFEVCRDKDLCNECPYEENIDCLRLREKHAIALMKSQEQRIKELTEDNEAQSKTITNLLKTIEGVQGVKSEYETFIGGMKTQIDKIKADAKANAVRKFAERVKNLAFERDNEIIDQITKEMLEENK